MRMRESPAVRLPTVIFRKTFATQPEIRAIAKRLFEQGFGYQRTAQLLNLNVNTVRDWSREFKKGRFKVEVSPNQFRYPRETQVKVVDMRFSGYSWKEIERRTGISISTCRKWFLQYCENEGIDPELPLSRGATHGARLDKVCKSGMQLEAAESAAAV